MALKDTWVDKVNGEDIVDAEDINGIADAVIELEENLPSRMPSVDSMGNISSLQTSDAFIVYDVPGGVMARLTWGALRGIIDNYLNGRVIAGSVTDEAGSGFVATIPELEADTTLLTAADMPDIVSEVLAELPNASGVSF